MASSAIFEEALKAYRSIHPHFNIPQGLTEDRLLEILQNSKGREITFYQKDKHFEAYFSDANNEENLLKPEWKRLLGCGG